jgi:lipid II:glycine glycyltransferase (peptidoglycan interpeptide bridge formation enzyme)
MKTGQIQYVNRKEIDTKRWNACIDAAFNGLIYAYTDYLDGMCDNWDGLVMDDYAAVMPLPWRKKWSIHYLYQPFLTAQLGVFGNNLNQQLVESFFRTVPKKFHYWDFSLNHQNLFPITGFPLHQRSNYVLPLREQYEGLHKNYRENTRRNIKRSRQYGCTISTQVTVEDVVKLSKLQAKEASNQDFDNFKNLYILFAEKGLAKTYGVLSNAGELLASCVFLFSHNRAYYILVGNHPNGRTLGASHALIDGFIEDHAGQDLLLDFEGSDIRNLAFFYSSFGATEEKYAAIHLNRLPWWAKWLKK